MSFAAAVLKGLDADKRALDARREQEKVLADASDEISQAVRAEVVLQYKAHYTERAEFTAERIDLDRLGSKKVDGLEVRCGKRSLTLASISVQEYGYPLIVKWDHESELVSNNGEFRAALERLLEARSIGEKVAWVIGANRADTDADSEPGG